MRSVLRVVVGVVLGAIVGTVVFLIMIQGSFRQGYTDLDFNNVLGTMIKGTAEETGVSEAIGVFGDTARQTGLYATLIGAGVLMLLHALVIHPLVRRHWTVQGLVLGAVTALVVGVGFCAAADARLDTPTGIFGVDAGGITPLVIVLCSLGFGLAGARVHSLAVTPGWWEVQEEDAAAEIERVAALEPSEPSLELAEQGPEQGRVGA
ncbi:MAG TPA: hypothetical protein VK951_07745 [Miltoncostaeaceae bacterium]|nr:hypothetical protein [Miltoncostaeaceae bacterium]